MNRRGRNCFLEKSVGSKGRGAGDLVVEGFEKLLCQRGGALGLLSPPSLEMSRLNRARTAWVVKLAPRSWVYCIKVQFEDCIE
jgi:hypothetical protein